MDVFMAARCLRREGKEKKNFIDALKFMQTIFNEEEVLSVTGFELLRLVRKISIDPATVRYS